MSFLCNALSTAFALVGLNNNAYHGLALPCRENVNDKKALYSFNTVVTCPVYSTTTMGAVSAIEKMVNEAYPLDEAPEVPEAFASDKSQAPASSTCPSAPSTIPSSSPALSRASSADAAQLEEFPSGFFEEDDYCGLKDTVEEDDIPFDEGDFANADVKAILEGASMESSDTSFFGF